MKVLSLTEPCATLIKEKKKLIETRSWKIVPLPNAIKAKGHLSIWNYEEN